MKSPFFILPPGGLSRVPKADRPRYIRGLLTAEAVEVEELARITKRTVGYINMIINNERTGYRHRPVIAKRLGYSLTDLWPDTPTRDREAA